MTEEMVARDNNRERMRKKIESQINNEKIKKSRNVTHEEAGWKWQKKISDCANMDFSTHVKYNYKE
jgi:hypothetical protein